MGADRAAGGGRRPVRTVVSVACGAVLLAGCASMPDSGDLRGVESTPRQDTPVRVFALPPRENADAREIVDGFLEALTSDDPGFETAHKYLTKYASDRWDPKASLTVLAAGPDPEQRSTSGRDEPSDTAEFSLEGDKVATVDAQQAYAPADGQYDKRLHLVREKKSKQWRIDRPPPGVVMGKSDFLRNYTSVNRYYFASNSSTGSDTQPVAVADPVWVRKKVDPLTQTVSLLLAGPSRWLDPVVRSSYPTGTTLKKGIGSLAPDDQNRLTVPLNVKANRIGQDKCKEMAAQLLFTLRDLTPTGVDEVELQRSDGTRLCDLTEIAAENLVVHEAANDDYQYFVDGKHRLVRLDSDSDDLDAFEPVPGALGEGEKPLRSAAVSRDERKAAGVSLDGGSLYVGSLVSGASLGEPVLRSKGKTENDRLTTPSWDGDGDLWVADRDPDRPRLLLLKQGAGQPVEVDTTGLDGRIDAVRVAADGARIALIVEKGGKKSLYVGRIERGDEAGGEKAVAVVEPRSVTPQLEEVTAMSWAGGSRLVVVGRERGGVQQMAYVQVDGSTPVEAAPAALTGVKALASSENEQLPLLAYSEEDGIVRLSAGSKWQQVLKDGTAPVYPG
ncbi:LpqB family beta-propeller domain-containing protein [Streptomyces sp. S.PB5]|uniref:LpqB family beta-propeller domain-containing protein n=1 Tax=Streptomyces sp. S.PB5 TaxID=3020844 RepID=UPI0025B10C61|nr:LpqB family beta-propeller domain-containing protein [Streptomyces sp. S.PB5]MDN3028715.1 LpqB family beta-propeller domain-containing protein [Streptomyces sp. S.PB5]